MSPSKWVRRNLFRSPLDGILTVVVGGSAIYVLYRLLRFVLVTGRWTIVRDNLSLFIDNNWPVDQLWRVTVFMVLGALGVGIAVGYNAARSREEPTYEAPTGNPWARLFSRTWPIGLALVLLLAMATTIRPLLLVTATIAMAALGYVAGLRLPRRVGTPLTIALMVAGLAGVWLLIGGVEIDGWGGLMLNLFLAAISITLCFPIGLMMALGRQSKLPVIRWVSTAYIELFRGVPLLVLLLMAHVALGFFIPDTIKPGTVVRALVVLTLFTSAYVAEIVRGGLQSVPKGQAEAGKALGMSTLTITRRIVLPQALRNVIPAMVGQFISLFKDTTLVGVAMGLTDLLAGAQASTKQAAFQGQGLGAETLAFVMFLFWAGSYTMSNESAELETRLGVGT